MEDQEIMEEENEEEMGEEEFKTMVRRVIQFLDGRTKRLEEKEKKWKELELKMQNFAIGAPQRIVLDVGGTRFAISKNILLSQKGSMFEAIATGTWKPDADGSYFIDRTPQLFPVILDYLRTGSLSLTKFGYTEDVIADLLIEMDFYQIPVSAWLMSFGATTLLDLNQKKILLEWIGQRSVSLLYKASRDGFTSATFHSKCDNKGPTVVVVKSTNGYLFGGFASQPWDSSTGYKNVPGCFLFTLTNPHNIPPTKYPSVTDSNAMWCGSSYGPIFGGGHDICIYNNCNTSTSTIGFPATYKDTTGRGSVTFIGSNSFQVSELEVFWVK